MRRVRSSKSCSGYGVGLGVGFFGGEVGYFETFVSRFFNFVMFKIISGDRLDDGRFVSKDKNKVLFSFGCRY